MTRFEAGLQNVVAIHEQVEEEKAKSSTWLTILHQ